MSEISYPREGGGQLILADLKRLNVRHPHIAMVPQWDLIDPLASAGAEEPTFTLRMNTEVTDVLREGDTVVGVRYRNTTGAESEPRADLTVATDGQLVHGPPGGRPGAAGDTGRLRRMVAATAALGRRRDRVVAPQHHPRPSGGGHPTRGLLPDRLFAPKGADAEFRSAGIEPFRERIATCDVPTEARRPRRPT